MTREELEALGTELLLADDNDNPRLLAALAWRLYSEAGIAQGEVDRLHGMMRTTRRADDARHLVSQP
jgi:hypothetical protein